MSTRRDSLPLRLICSLVLTCVLACATVTVEAGQKTVHVKEYTRKDGTHVAAHDRKAPKTAGTTTTPTTNAESGASEATLRAYTPGEQSQVPDVPSALD